MDNEVFKHKMVLLAGTMFIGICAAMFLAMLAAASPNMPESEALAYGLPLLLANLLTLINAGILCCFTGGTKQTDRLPHVVGNGNHLYSAGVFDRVG